MELIKNFLPTEIFTQLKNRITSNEFDWYFNDSVVNGKDNYFQFFHFFYKNYTPTISYPLIAPILDKLEPVSILRIKSNLTTQSDKIIEHGFHNDYPNLKHLNYKTAIYYINTNDGYTLFEDGKKVKSEENSLIIFNGNKLHSGTNCTNKKCRIVINFNLIY